MLTLSSIFVGKVARVEANRTRYQVHSDCIKILPQKKSGLAIWQVPHGLHFCTCQTLSDLYELSCLPNEFEKMNPQQKQKGVAMRFCDFPWHISTKTSIFPHLLRLAVCATILSKASSTKQRICMRFQKKFLHFRLKHILRLCNQHNARFGRICTICCCHKL